MLRMLLHAVTIYRKVDMNAIERTKLSKKKGQIVRVLLQVKYLKYLHKIINTQNAIKIACARMFKRTLYSN